MPTFLIHSAMSLNGGAVMLYGGYFCSWAGDTFTTERMTCGRLKVIRPDSILVIEGYDSGGIHLYMTPASQAAGCISELVTCRCMHIDQFQASWMMLQECLMLAL